jgi:hypothetical protein
MGWGVCFALDANDRVYCADGCKWRSTAGDYAGYPEWPSARKSVLDYFEGRDAHSELDMVRDECPGTASALAAACDEHMSTALEEYNTLSDEEKQGLHDAKMKELESDLVRIKRELESSLEKHKYAKKAWEEYKKKPSKAKPAKTRADEIRQAMAPYRIELEMEEAAEEYDRLQKAKASVTRLLNREKRFHL